MGFLDTLLGAFKQSGGNVLDSITSQATSAVNRTISNKTNEAINKVTDKMNAKKQEAKKAEPAKAQPKADDAKAQEVASEPIAADKIYMIKERGKQSGPYSKSEIEQMIKSSRLNADSPIRKGGMDYWGTVYELSEFYDLVK